MARYPIPTRWRERLFPLLAVFLGTTLPLTAQEPEKPVPAWEEEWARLLTQDELGAQARLEAQTELLLETMRRGTESEASLWEKVTTLLDQWEGSPEIETGRQAYVDLLSGVGGPLTGRDAAFLEEDAFRAYLQKALSLEIGPVQEGRLLLYLAESLLRSHDLSVSIKRRVETLLQEALSALDGESPAEAVHYRLGELYSLWPATGEARESEREVPYLSRAVSHLQTVMELPQARDGLKQKARERLEILLAPELELEIGHRFLPQSEVRISLRSRNIDAMEITLTGLPVEAQLEAASLETLEQILTADPVSPERILMEDRHTLDSRHLSDWQTREVILGDSYPSGWYGVIVEGEGLRRHGLLLISTLEVALLTRGNGDLLVWIVDGETGQQVEGAEASLLDREEKLLFKGLTAIDGTLVIPRDETSGWAQLYVFSGKNPGILRREDLPGPVQPVSWIFVNPVDLRPGSTLHWCLISGREGIAWEASDAIDFIFPGGRILTGSASKASSDSVFGSMTVPLDFLNPGPVYARPDGKNLVQVAFLHDVRERPLSLQFTGDRLDAENNLFSDSAPVTAVLVLSPEAESVKLPDFIRFRLSRLHRNAFVPEPETKGSPSTEVTLIHESIYSLEGIRESGIPVEIPEVSTDGLIVPLSVEILPLNDDQPLAVGYLGLSPFRETIQFEVDEHLIRPGETIDVHYRMDVPGRGSGRSMEGEFTIFRETWESRYIHRRRGTTLSEEAYRALPDRSLLGAAKTDYRLSEQGFVREEVKRVPLELAQSRGTLPVELERGGKYIIEFAGREGDSRALYPEGPLEVWVIPDGTDLRAFRSEKPRLVIDRDALDRKEALLLLDRSQPSLLIDIERWNGSRSMRVQEPVEAAVFFQLSSDEDDRVRAMRILAVGNRQTDYLWSDEVMAETGEWNLRYPSLFGLNPDSPFAWPLEKEGTGSHQSPVIWTFFPEAENPLAHPRIRWQEALHLIAGEEAVLPVTYLTQWLPLRDPFKRPFRADARQVDSALLDYMDPEAFMCLFPELRKDMPETSAAYPFQLVEDADSPVLEGTFPGTSGRWRLSAFSPIGGRSVKVRDWLVSTELPIRSKLSGPSQLRQDDKTRLMLEVDNTTSREVPLRAVVKAGEGVAPEGYADFDVNLDAAQSGTFPVRIRAIRPVESEVEVELQRAGEVLSRSGHRVDVLSDDAPPGSRFYVASGQRDSHAARLSTAGIREPVLTVNAGIGALLPSMKKQVLFGLDGAEPLLEVLVNWAHAKAFTHHGIASVTEPAGYADSLTEILGAYQTEEGGWSWLPGLEADPWLSALVAWTLETFAGTEETEFAAHREAARDYLESVLVRSGISSEERLFALRALAVSAFHFNEIRPSRIQARTLLDFLHRYQSLSSQELSMLLEVARAYGFREEVRLLSGAALDRLEKQEAEPFWKLALICLVLGEEEPGSMDFDALLARTLEAFSGEPVKRGWTRVCGYLNLLAHFYWQGDFNQEGRVLIGLGEDEPVEYSLGPGADTPPRMELPFTGDHLNPDGELGLRIDTSSALNSVIFSIDGKAVRPAMPEAGNGVRVDWYRMYFENTLMKGLRRKSAALDPSLNGVTVGDSLEVLLHVEMEEGWKYAEFQFPFPAGLDMEIRRIQHDLVNATGPAASGGNILINGSGDALAQGFRMTPLQPGDHRFKLRFNVRWPGDYFWPAMRAINPKTGEAIILYPETRLRIRAGAAD